MEIITKISRAVGVILLGIVYVKLLTSSMSQLHKFTGDTYTDFGKISFVATAVLISCTIVFLLNAYILKGNKKHLGFWCAIFAFIYFYIVRAEGNVMGLLIGVFMFLHSAAAFFLFLITPIVIGFLITKRHNKI